MTPGSPSSPTTPGQGPHAGQRLLHAGAPLDEASMVMIMVHGRGAGPGDILGLSGEIHRQGLCFLAPEAAGWSWYPQSFLAPRRANEPYLSSAIHQLASLLQRLETGGVPRRRMILMGFSQGACLSLEVAARHQHRYAGVVAFSGGLIGAELDADYGGPGLAGTPVFLGCSDRDPHIPLPRVQESSKLMERLGGVVTERIYPGMPHTINQDEIRWLQSLVDEVTD